MAKKNRHRGRFQYNNPMKKVSLSQPDWLKGDSEKKAWERLVGKGYIKEGK